jgi:hypothetical protein
MPGCSSLTLERWSFWNNYTRGGGQEGPWSLIEAIVIGVFHCILLVSYLAADWKLFAGRVMNGRGVQGMTCQHGRGSQRDALTLKEGLSEGRTHAEGRRCPGDLVLWVVQLPLLQCL